MEPEEEPGGAAVREVYEEVTKTKKIQLVSADGNQEERGNSSLLYPGFNWDFHGVETQRTAVLCIRIGV